MATITASVLLGLALLQGAEAYWRMPCGVIQTGRIDPIINSGTVSGHVHKIAGPPSISPNSTYDSLQDNRCTSCQVQADKSAYWTPLLYYRHANGSFEEVTAGGMTVYYLGRGENQTNIQVFPKGFKMLSGDPTLRAYDNSTYTFGGVNGVIYTGGHCRTGDGTCTGGTFVNRTGTNDPPGPVFTGRPVSDRVSYACLDQNGPFRETPSMSRLACSNGLRAQIQFPSCWNGVDLYKPDNSHVAYLSQIDNGICPPTHPILFPHLFFEVLYSVSTMSQDGGEFVFAEGDPTGYSFHGDFMNGWDEDVLQSAIDQCVNVDNGGGVGSCAPFLPSLDYNSGINCPEQPPLFDEAVHGMIGTKLPGCINVTPGPQPASLGDFVCPPGTPSPTKNTTYKYGGGIPPSNPAIGRVQNGYTYLGCFNDDSPHSFSQASIVSDSMTNEFCQSFCGSKNMPLAATEYGKECYCAYNLNSTLNYKESCNNMICAANSSQYCGGPLSLNLWNSTTYRGSYNPTLPSPGASIGGGYTFLGCANEATNARALKVASITSANMTNDYCANFCASKNLPLFGTEYSDECYCGYDLVGDSTLGKDGCNMQCSAIPPPSSPFAAWANLCGGSSRLAVWNNTKIGAAVSSSLSATISSSTPASSSIPTSSSASTSAKTASSATLLSVSSSVMSSIAKSVLTTSGTASSTSSAARSTATTLMRTTSTATSITTSATALSPSATLANSPYIYLGCASEASSGRALNVSSTTSSSNMTNDFCGSYCASKGLPLFGTEYGTECYCGNTLATGSTLGQTGCTKSCSGPVSNMPANSPFVSVENTCGGGSRLSVWNNTKISAVSSLKNFTLSNTQWAYSGCYQEASSGRVLSSASWSGSSGVNVTSCASFCQTKGYKLAGIEYAGECYCGNSMANGGVKADEWTCNMQCKGDQSSWCGGSSRLSVYAARS